MRKPRIDPRKLGVIHRISTMRLIFNTYKHKTSKVHRDLHNENNRGTRKRRPTSASFLDQKETDRSRETQTSEQRTLETPQWNEARGSEREEAASSFCNRLKPHYSADTRTVKMPSIWRPSTVMRGRVSRLRCEPSDLSRLIDEFDRVRVADSDGYLQREENSIDVGWHPDPMTRIRREHGEGLRENRALRRLTDRRLRGVDGDRGIPRLKQGEVRT